MSWAGHNERGRVSLRVAPDSERASLALHDGTVAAFGRGVDCPIRFGHAPIQDRGVPRLCGWLIVANGRIIVHASEDGGEHRPGSGTETEFRPLLVTPRSGPPRTVSPGEAWAPADEIFTVNVVGTSTWELNVVNRRDPIRPQEVASSDRPTVKPFVDLSDELWSVLQAYGEPMRFGKSVPASHEEVAERTNDNPRTVRRHLETIYDEFYLRRIDMPDVADLRIKVVQGALNHGLLGRPTNA